MSKESLKAVFEEVRELEDRARTMMAEAFEEPLRESVKKRNPQHGRQGIVTFDVALDDIKFTYHMEVAKVSGGLFLDCFGAFGSFKEYDRNVDKDKLKKMLTDDEFADLVVQRAIDFLIKERFKAENRLGLPYRHPGRERVFA